MSNQEIFRMWAEAATMVATAKSTGLDWMKATVQTSGRGDMEFILAWVTDFNSHIMPNERAILMSAYLPNCSKGTFYSESVIDGTQRDFWDRIGHKRGHFESEAIRFKRMVRS